MKYVIRAFLGLGLMALSITSASYALYQFLQIGTCERRPLRLRSRVPG